MQIDVTAKNKIIGVAQIATLSNMEWALPQQTAVDSSCTIVDTSGGTSNGTIYVWRDGDINSSNIINKGDRITARVAYGVS